MTDGYETYNSIAERYKLVHLGCLVHARRYFVKAEKNVPKAARTPDLLATRFIKLFGKLFAAQARSKTWSTDRRQRLRQRYSAHVLEVIRVLMIEQSPGVLPQSLLGRALSYLCEQWPKLVTSRTVTGRHRTILVKIPFARLSLHARDSCSQIRLPAHMSAQICLLSFKPAKPMASIHTVT